MDSVTSRAKLPEIPVLVDALRDQLDGVVICLSRSWGGLEQVAATDATELAELGLNIQVLCLEGSPIHENLSRQKRVETLPLDFQPRNTLDLKMRVVLQRLLLQGVNLVHLHQPSLLGSIVPWIWQKKELGLFATRHIMNDHMKKDFVHRMIYGRLDGLLTISETMRQNVLETHAIREKRVKVVNLGLDFTQFDPERVNPKEQRERWGADKDTTVIGMVGRIDPAKGQATFIRAAAGLLKNHDRPGNMKLKFVIVGEETLGSVRRHLEELKQMVAQFRLGDQVVFAGYQENIPEVMRAFDIFVMPSRQEAFGLVAIEALAMERPIVISNSGSAAEIVGEEEYGLTIRPDDAFDLQTKLRILLENPKMGESMGQKGRAHARKNYDRKARLRLTLALYERALRIRGVL